MQPNKDQAPETIVGISFDGILRAQEFMTAATRLGVEGTFAMHDAVLVVKDSQGNTKVRESIDPQPGRSAMSGAMWSGLFGLILGGPVGWLAGAAIGASAGAGAAKLIDLGVTDEWITWFREAVRPDTATVVLLISNVHREALVAEASRFTGAELVYANFDHDTITRLKDALGDTTPITEASQETTPA